VIINVFTVICDQINAFFLKKGINLFPEKEKTFTNFLNTVCMLVYACVCVYLVLCGEG